MPSAGRASQALGFDYLGGDERVEEGVVLFLGEGAVDVVGGALVPAGGEVDLVHVDGGGVDDGGDAVVEGELFGAGEALEFGGERRAGERAAGEDGDGVGIVFVEVGDFFATDFDVWLRGDEVGDAAGEFDAVDGEGVAGGNGAGVGGLQEEGAGAAHLLLEQPGRGVFAFALEGVRADELGKVGGLVGFGGAEGAHLREDDVAAEVGGLESGFGAGEAAADYVDLFHLYSGYVFIAMDAGQWDAANALRGSSANRMMLHSDMTMAPTCR